jgi:hypothetical protein
MTINYSPPHLHKTKTSAQLIVHGEPFLMLAGELHNSSLSSARFMQDVYPEMRKMNVNTLLGSVTWEMIEPEEGRFDFAELDAVIEGARQHDMHLVLLWFGSFKNALSTYVPGMSRISDVAQFRDLHYLSLGQERRQALPACACSRSRRQIEDNRTAATVERASMDSRCESIRAAHEAPPRSRRQ